MSGGAEEDKKRSGSDIVIYAMYQPVRYGSLAWACLLSGEQGMEGGYGNLFNMGMITIDRAGPGDILQLHRIATQTFTDTFSVSNSEENMNHYLQNVLSRERLLNELKNHESDFYLAKIGDDAVGYLKLNVGQAQTELKADNSLEIERIYVHKEFLGKAVGQLLFETALEAARNKKLDYIWLGVWEKNARAIGFYKKNGFVEFDQHIFRLGDDEQVDILMKRPIKSGQASF